MRDILDTAKQEKMQSPPSDVITNAALDRQVAEIVMGWNIYKVMDAPSKSPGDFVAPCLIDYGDAPGFPPRYLPARGVWPHDLGFWSPSTSIKDAFDVVEKMREAGWKFILGEGSEREYGCRFIKRGHPFADGEADDVPRAICLAALSAPDEKGLANPEGDAPLSEKEIEHGN